MIERKGERERGWQGVSFGVLIFWLMMRRRGERVAEEEDFIRRRMSLLLLHKERRILFTFVSFKVTLRSKHSTCHFFQPFEYELCLTALCPQSERMSTVRIPLH